MSGAPAFYESPEELQFAIDKYFDYIKGEFHFEADPKDESKDIKIYDRSAEPATITGLCLFLGFDSRQSFHDYGKRESFSYTIKKARLRIENHYEITLQYSRSPAAQIFALKNLGWDDKQQIDHTSNGEKIQNTPIVFTSGSSE